MKLHVENLFRFQEGLNSVREIIGWNRDSDGSSKRKMPKMKAMAESLQSVIDSSASGAIALQICAIQPLLNNVRCMLQFSYVPESCNPDHVLVLIL